MAYKIRYTDTSVIKNTKVNFNLPIKWVAGILVLLFLCGLLRLESVQNLFIPGDPAVTRSAFSTFTRELQEGEKLRDAVAAFCLQIIESESLE